MEENSATTIKPFSKPNMSAYKWSKWITKFEEKNKEIIDDKIKISTMLELAGKQIKKIYQGLKDEDDTFADVVRKISFFDNQNFFHFPQITKKIETPESQLVSKSRTQFIDSYSNAKSFIQKTVYTERQKIPSSRTEKNATSSLEFESTPTPNPLNILSNNNRPLVQIQIMNTTVSMLVDSGSTINVIDLATYEKLKPKPVLEPSKMKVFSYNSKTPIQTLGQFSAILSTNSKMVQALFHVVNGSSGCILKYSTSKDLGLIEVKNDLIVKDEPLNQFYIKNKIPSTPESIAPTILLFNKKSSLHRPVNSSINLKSAIKEKVVKPHSQEQAYRLDDLFLVGNFGRHKHKTQIVEHFPPYEKTRQKSVKTVRFLNNIPTIKPLKQFNFDWNFENKIILPIGIRSESQEGMQKFKREKDNLLFASLPFN